MKDGMVNIEIGNMVSVKNMLVKLGCPCEFAEKTVDGQYNMRDVISYIIELLVGKEYASDIAYSKDLFGPALVTIVPSIFFDDSVYGTSATLPKTPLSLLPDTNIPFLFGEPRVERAENGKIILYADLVASAYFVLFRYEEIIKPKSRDRYGRFRAKDSVVFQQGYGMRPLVDEWGRYLRNLLRELGVEMPLEKHGFSKIYLTHDVDLPFRVFDFRSLVIQYVANILKPNHYLRNPLRVLISEESDPYYTFPKIIKYDDKLRKAISIPVESIYFIIAANGKEYCNIMLKKFRRLVDFLKSSGVTLGLHVSHEAGKNPIRITKEMARLHKFIPASSLKSRHHFLRWTEPEHIEQMQSAGITEDFTLGYADSVGFRVGTCKPYRFINPRTRQLSDVIIHPMQIMECSLDRLGYMGLDYNDALNYCKTLIDQTYQFNGELNLLWHNTSFFNEDNPFSYDAYYEKLYLALIDYIIGLSS